MKTLFAIDGRVYAVLNVMVELLELNLLFIIGCLPIVTIGSSAVSLYEVVFQIRKEGTVRVLPRFWKAFRGNLLKGIVLWAIVAATFAAMVLSYWMLSNTSHGNILVLLPMCVIIAVLLLASGYVFALAGRYDMGVAAIVRASLSLALQHAFISALAVILFLAVVCLIPVLLPRLLFLWVFFAFGLTAYLHSWLLIRVFEQHGDAG
ncbi:MAG: DUF624 domain-containing protein [Bifidobacterium psychraerophilum]|uniref:DUF624 domain-containing protein n=1 Tax=Bifidobacterium psychraerophilum TaxID=218140 RepID=UPI0039E8F119